MTEREQRRLVNHRLAVLQHAEEVTGNVAQTCRYYGISRPTFYKWLNRYEEKGLEGLRDRSSQPHHCPHATNAEVVGKIIYLQQNYHFGPAKIISSSAWVTHRYTRDEVDWIAVYDATTEICLYLPPDLWDGKGWLNLRLAPTANGQRKGIRFAEDFRILGSRIRKTTDIDRDSLRS